MSTSVLMIENEQLKHRISKLFHIHHPRSDIAFNSYMSRSGNDNMFVTVLLGTVEHSQGGIAMNDPGYMTFQISQVGPTTYELTSVNGTSILVKPDIGISRVFGSVKVPFRKTTGSLSSVVSALGRFFTRRAIVINDNWSNIQGVLQMYKPVI